MCVWKAAIIIIIFSFFLFFLLRGPTAIWTPHTHNTTILNLRLQSATIFPELDQDLWLGFLLDLQVSLDKSFGSTHLLRMTNICNVWTKMDADKKGPLECIYFLCRRLNNLDIYGVCSLLVSCKQKQAAAELILWKMNF